MDTETRQIIAIYQQALSNLEDKIYCHEKADATFHSSGRRDRMLEERRWLIGEIKSLQEFGR